VKGTDFTQLLIQNNHRNGSEEWRVSADKWSSIKWLVWLLLFNKMRFTFLNLIYLSDTHIQKRTH